MKIFRFVFLLIIAISLGAANAFAADEEFDSDKMMSELESQLQLNSEKLSKLKPAIDSKSAELKKSIHDAVDKGCLHLDELTERLDAVSKEAEQKVKEFLDSEELARLKDYMNKIDEEAIKDVKDQLVQELTAYLDLTQEQIMKLKPILEDSITQLSEMLDMLAKEGSKGWEEFKRQYEEFSKELREKLQGTLDDEQMQKLDKYNEEKKEKIHTALFSV